MQRIPGPHGIIHTYTHINLHSCMNTYTKLLNSLSVLDSLHFPYIFTRIHTYIHTHMDKHIHNRYSVVQDCNGYDSSSSSSSSSSYNPPGWCLSENIIKNFPPSTAEELCLQKDPAQIGTFQNTRGLQFWLISTTAYVHADPDSIQPHVLRVTAHRIVVLDIRKASKKKKAYI